MSAPASPLPPPGPFDPALVSADGKNAKTIECNLCKCKILRAGKGVYLKETLPLVTGKDKEERPETDWWVVADIWDFDNMGFSHTVTGKKYLTCASCERGILGVHVQGAGGRILVAHSRVHYI